MTTATETAVVAAATKTYDRPYLPRGAYFAMLREQGLLKPRERSASAKPAASKKAANTVEGGKAASRAAFAKRRHFANRAKAAKDPSAPKKVYDTPYMTKGQWFKMMRETGQLAPRQPKAQPVAETAVVETAVA
ncbi:MAG: hypothetical protein DI537_10535 [Stutzerimonas stutzeri]|nr:MAG: hypothetical protein DI537_10535 [Stutzerimonas stutzeri]